MHLDYLTGDGRTGRGTVGRIPAATELANQANLLAAAARLRRLFVLPVPDAPGAVFVGAEVAPAAFDLPAPDGPAIGVSGIGLSLRDAFERCVGEAAEYLSMIRRGDEVVTRATVQMVIPITPDKAVVTNSANQSVVSRPTG